MLTSKFYDDDCLNNKIFAKVGGIETIELMNMEIYFLEIIDYSLLITIEDYLLYVEKIKHFNTLHKA